MPATPPAPVPARWQQFHQPAARPFALHQPFDTGVRPLQILGIFAATPVATWLPDGVAIDLPWRSWT